MPRSLIKRELETCRSSIRQWCEEREGVGPLPPEEDGIISFINLVRNNGAEVTSRQARDVAYHMQAMSDLSATESRILMQTWCHDIILHAKSTDEFLKVLQSTMIEVMVDCGRTAITSADAKDKASAAKAMTGICRDMVVIEERRKLAIQTVGEIETDPNELLAEREAQVAEDKRLTDERMKKFDQARKDQEEAESVGVG